MILPIIAAEPPHLAAALPSAAAAATPPGRLPLPDIDGGCSRTEPSAATIGREKVSSPSSSSSACGAVVPGNMMRISIESGWLRSAALSDTVTQGCPNPPSQQTMPCSISEHALAPHDLMSVVQSLVNATKSEHK